nr:PAS domain-containing sensor histidine kinase [Alteromonas sp. 5E99-2]
MESLLKVLPAGVVVINGKGVVIQSNPQAIELLGEPLENELWRDVIARAFKPRADDGHEVSLTNGKRVKLAISPLEGEPGQLILLTDLTETRQLQSRISHMQRLSSLGNMVASLAHQIRTPLSAAMLYAANLVQPTMDDATRVKFSNRVNDRLKELESQVNDMLLFAKSGDQQVLAPLTMADIFNSVLPTAQILADKRKVNLKVDDVDLPMTISGNLTALQGALLNLIDNAIQVSQPGDDVNVRVEWLQNDVSIHVIDQGPGVPFGIMKQIFSPFYTTKTNGTGLGLAVVKSVMQSHGGNVTLKNETDRGAHFILTLPAQASLSLASGE